MDPRISKAQGLLEQAEYLSSPHRKSGPSVEEAASVVGDLRRQADELLDEAFYAVPVNRP